jgi:copper homeostasis protein (lipoprotein)
VARLLALLAGCAMSDAGAEPAADGRPDLPASFAGSLPCAGSAGARAQLDLWPDGVFHLRRQCVGTPGRDDDRGRWQLTPDGDGIRLHGGREMPLAFAWRGHDALVPLDMEGRPAVDAATALSRLPAFAPADLQLALHGMFRYLADAAGFEECLTGRSYPVAMEGDFVALERAYMASEAGGTGTPIMASFDGEIADRPAMEGGGATATVIVTRFVNLWPRGRCERAMSRASLAETYWKLVRLRGEPVVTLPHQSEAHLILRPADDRYKGSFGCFRYDGQYRVNGGEIAFDAPRWTAGDACTSSDPNSASPPRSEYSDALGAAHRWTINEQVLEWFDATGASVALFEAVYLR